MTDQQQCLANLVHAAFSAGHAAGQESDTDHHAAFQSWQEDADVLGAIAAMTAEPTDAEVTVAQRVYWETLQSVQDEYTTDQEKSRYAMRIALYAARKVGQP
jgi:hypothetical protein